MFTPTSPDEVAGSSGGLDVEPLTRALGAIVHGLDLTQPLADGDVSHLRDLVVEHQVVFVRDQHLAEHQLRALARQFGPLSMHPVARLTGTDRDVNVIEDSAERPPAGFDWHTDLSWTAEPPHFGFLSAVDVPAIGGDTLWASGRAIYDRLDPARQRQLGALRIVHAPDDALLDTVRRHHGAALAEQLIAGHPPIQHPLVRRDPHAASPALWLSPLYARSVAGLSEGASSRLLRSLHRELDNPEVQVRWRWSVGDIAIWDESTTCHRALTDHAPQRRVMRRCTTAGERPAPASRSTPSGARFS